MSQPSDLSHQAALSREMQASLDRTAETARNIRPTNTVKAYAGPQAEWRVWCETKNYPEATRYTVSAEKLHLFLESEVVGRASRKRGRRSAVPLTTAATEELSITTAEGPSTTAATGEDSTAAATEGPSTTAATEGPSTTAALKTVGLDTLENYAAALTSLYFEQRAAKVNGNTHPREGPVRDLLQNVKEQEYKRKRDAFVDKGQGTSLDGYQNLEKLVNIIDYYMQNNYDVKWAAIFLQCHSLLLRGDNARTLELSDLHMIEAPNDGFTRCPVMVACLRNGKTNRHNRTELAGVVRNKNPKST